MGKEIIAFGDLEVEKHKFDQHKNPMLIYNINIDRIVVTSKVSYEKQRL